MAWIKLQETGSHFHGIFLTVYMFFSHTSSEKSLALMLQISWKRLRRAVILAGLVNLILMPLPAEIKTCLTCGAPLIGRVDKKFCDDYCRSMYNNKALTFF